MTRKAIVNLSVVLVLIVLITWGWSAISEDPLSIIPGVRADTGIRFVSVSVENPEKGIEPEVNESVEALMGRVLVWSTIANVPRSIGKIEGGTDLLDILGVPGAVQRDLKGLGVVPARNEWNVGSIDTSDLRAGLSPIYHTYKSGTFLNNCVSPDGRFIVSTCHFEQGQYVVRIDRGNGMEPVAISRKIDRWPSISEDGKSILYHSYRDGNPGGDLYLAKENRSVESGWEIIRLTNDTKIEDLWPKMSADGSRVISFQRGVTSDIGRLTLFSLNGNKLEFEMYLTDDKELVMFPSLNRDGSIAVWQCQDEKGKWSMCIVEPEASETRTIVSPSGFNEFLNEDWIQPSISPDGRYICFVVDTGNHGENGIGIYDRKTKMIHSIKGCEGQFMFPAISDKVDE